MMETNEHALVEAEEDILEEFSQIEIDQMAKEEEVDFYRDAPLAIPIGTVMLTGWVTELRWESIEGFPRGIFIYKGLSDAREDLRYWDAQYESVIYRVQVIRMDWEKPSQWTCWANDDAGFTLMSESGATPYYGTSVYKAKWGIELACGTWGVKAILSIMTPDGVPISYRTDPFLKAMQEGGVQ